MVRDFVNWLYLELVASGLWHCSPPLVIWVKVLWVVSAMRRRHRSEGGIEADRLHSKLTLCETCRTRLPVQTQRLSVSGTLATAHATPAGALGRHGECGCG
jgi:hypothetical protein